MLTGSGSTCDMSDVWAAITRIALAAAAMTVLILPVVVGAMNPVAQVRGESAPRSEVASIKLNTTATIPLSAAHLAFLRAAGAGNSRDGRFQGGRRPCCHACQCVDPKSPTTSRTCSLMEDLPGCAPIVTKWTPEPERCATFDHMRPMLQSLLADRFKLTLRRETRQLTVYDLLPDRGGLKIMPMKEGSCLPA